MAKTPDCKETMLSNSDPTHTHYCGGTHEGRSHKCKDSKCGKYFWKKGELA